MPLIDRHLTEAEWQDVGQRGFEKFTPDQRWIAMGQMVEVVTPTEAAMMFGTLLPPVKVLWQLIGKRKYRRYITSVRGQQLVGTGRAQSRRSAPGTKLGVTGAGAPREPRKRHQESRRECLGAHSGTRRSGR